MARRWWLVLALTVACGGCRSQATKSVPNMVDMTQVPASVPPSAAVVPASATSTDDDGGTVPYGCWTRDDRGSQTVDLEITPKTIRFCAHLGEGTRIVMAGQWTSKTIGRMTGVMTRMTLMMSSSSDFDFETSYDEDAAPNMKDQQPFEMDFRSDSGDFIVRNFKGGGQDTRLMQSLEGRYKFVRESRPKAEKP